MIGDENGARAFVEERCGPLVVSQFETLIKELRAENAKQNLVSHASLDHAWLRHIADSVQLLDFVPDDWNDWLDLGTGAGFPGLVIAIAHPDRRVNLVESRKRRVEWLERMVAQFELSHCVVHGCRLELVDSFNAGVISARAFAPLPKLLNLSSRFSTGSTSWVLPKGRSAGEEVSGLDSRHRSMFHVKHSLTDAAAGIVVGRAAAR